MKSHLCTQTRSLAPSLHPSHTDRQTDRFWKIICEEEQLIPKLVSSPLLFWVSQRQLIELGFLSLLHCFGFLPNHTQFALHPPVHTHTCSYSFDSVHENHREKDRQTDRQTEKGMGITGVLDSGQKRLQELGYKQELQRDLSVISNFAFSFAIISILTGVTTLFNTGLTYGGTISMVYGWLITGFFTMFVGLSMAEICSAFPTSGGLYFWSSQLSGPKWGPFASWITGWYVYYFSLKFFPCLQQSSLTSSRLPFFPVDP